MGAPGFQLRPGGDDLPGQRRPQQMRLTRRGRLFLFAPLAVLLTGWLGLPALLGLFATFSTYAPFATSIHFAGLSNYLSVIEDRQFGAAVRDIPIFTGVAVPPGLALGFGVSYF